MARTRLFNPSLDVLVLPYPMRGVVMPGEYEVADVELADFATYTSSAFVRYVGATETAEAATLPTPDTTTATEVLAALAAVSASINVNSQKITGLAAATGNGEATRYEQVVRTTGNQTTLTGTKSWEAAHTFSGGVVVNTVPLKDFTGTVTAILALTSPAPGMRAFATDGRKPGQGAASGTGQSCSYDGTAWRSDAEGTTIAA